MTTDTVTPYSTVTPYATGVPTWAGAEAGERLAAYTSYQNMYWSEEGSFPLIRRNEDGTSLYLPKPKLIADTTAYYLMKGMTVAPADPEKQKELAEAIKVFCARERFYSRWDVAKRAGVIRGDWVLHLTADPTKPEGSRLSINSVDPSVYFPEFDADDLNRRTGVKLVEQQQDPKDPNKVIVKILRYWYELDDDGNRLDQLVWREENLWEMEGWNNPEKAKKLGTLIPAATLPSNISQIPVYHWKNAEFDGFEFGNSELKGYERVFQAIDQAMSDTEISLALVGLGVYATDAGRPKDAAGKDRDWIVAPGMVWEMPGATMVKRLEGITSVTPVTDFVGKLEESLYESSGTSDVALGKVDAQIAESGIALALRFVPTLAKIEQRDISGVEILTQMWYDWKFWLLEYEGQNFIDQEIVISLGEKLPLNRQKVIEELNNLLDRKVISRAFFRAELTRRLGYDFPEGMAEQILAEEAELAAVMSVATQPSDGEDGVPGKGGRKQGAGDTLPKPNQSNNKDRVNESNGTEANK